MYSYIHDDGLGSIPGQSIWDLLQKTWHCGKFSPHTSVIPANSDYTKRSTVSFTNRIWYKELLAA
jgi:hypothetical protein